MPLNFIFHLRLLWYLGQENENIRYELWGSCCMLWFNAIWKYFNDWLLSWGKSCHCFHNKLFRWEDIHLHRRVSSTVQVMKKHWRKYQYIFLCRFLYSLFTMVFQVKYFIHTSYCKKSSENRPLPKLLKMWVLGEHKKSKLKGDLLQLSINFDYLASWNIEIYIY